MVLNYGEFKVNGGSNIFVEDFFSQFEVILLIVGKEGGNGYLKNIILDDVNFKDLYLMFVKNDVVVVEKIKK